MFSQAKEERENIMFEIVKANGEFVMDEVDQSRAPQVPSFMSDPARNAKRLRRLMQEEQPIANTVNMIAWSVVCVMIGWIIALI